MSTANIVLHLFGVVSTHDPLTLIEGSNSSETIQCVNHADRYISRYSSVDIYLAVSLCLLQCPPPFAVIARILLTVRPTVIRRYLVQTSFILLVSVCCSKV